MSRYTPRVCAECDGAGYLVRIVGEGYTSTGSVYPIESERRCEDCDGTGITDDELEAA